MSSRIEATIDDLYRVGSKAELVGGEIVMMSPTGGFSNIAAGQIYRRLADYAERTGRGYAFTDNAAFVVNLPDRKSFSPDAAYHVGAVSRKFIQGPPVFAVEVRSESDYGPAAEEAMAETRSDYFAAGTQVVWDVDLDSSEVVRVYRAGDPEHATIFRRGQMAEAEPAVPGWTMAVDELFPAPRR